MPAPDGLDVLAFGERHYPLGSAYLPRAGVSWGLGTWAPGRRPEDHPWKREAEAGAPEVPELSPRPARIVNVAAVERGAVRTGPRCGRRGATSARAAGSSRTGLNHVTIEPGALMAPPHCHSAEEEIFVVLDGDGELELWPSRRYGGELETHALRAGLHGRPSCRHAPAPTPSAPARRG